MAGPVVSKRRMGGNLRGIDTCTTSIASILRAGPGAKTNFSISWKNPEKSTYRPLDNLGSPLA